MSSTEIAEELGGELLSEIAKPTPKGEINKTSENDDDGSFSHSNSATTSVANLHPFGTSAHPWPDLVGGSGFNLAKRLSA